METLSGELNLRLSQVIDSLMNMLQAHISRAISSAIKGRVIPKIQSIMGMLSSGQRYSESGVSTSNQQ